MEKQILVPYDEYLGLIETKVNSIPAEAVAADIFIHFMRMFERTNPFQQDNLRQIIESYNADPKGTYLFQVELLADKTTVSNFKVHRKQK